jgi:hypothetical protein
MAAHLLCAALSSCRAFEPPLGIRCAFEKKWARRVVFSEPPSGAPKGIRRAKNEPQN